jgi:hypothetical protein
LVYWGFYLEKWVTVSNAPGCINVAVITDEIAVALKPGLVPPPAESKILNRYI